MGKIILTVMMILTAWGYSFAANSTTLVRLGIADDALDLGQHQVPESEKKKKKDKSNPVPSPKPSPSRTPKPKG